MVIENFNNAHYSPAAKVFRTDLKGAIQFDAFEAGWLYGLLTEWLAENKDCGGPMIESLMARFERAFLELT